MKHLYKLFVFLLLVSCNSGNKNFLDGEIEEIVLIFNGLREEYEGKKNIQFVIENPKEISLFKEYKDQFERTYLSSPKLPLFTLSIIVKNNNSIQEVGQLVMNKERELVFDFSHNHFFNDGLSLILLEKINLPLLTVYPNKLDNKNFKEIDSMVQRKIRGSF